MKLEKAWNSKTIQKHIGDSRIKYNQLYKGEKYLISKFIKNNDRILDIGCGQGGLCAILQKKYKKIYYTGIDFNKKMIKVAKSNFTDGQFYHYAENNYIRFLKRKYDVVVIFGILHLNSDWKKILINASKVADRAILFDHRVEFEENIKQNFYLDLDSKSRNKKYRINYILLRKNNLENFLKLKIKKFFCEQFNYNGFASKLSNIKKKITFANVALVKK